ncbi:AvrD family protein [Streptomyces sp. ISL-94]|uniref:AvrD family protein n=1 Tax=Streptomyces sp. ISL-94 TaxID=2819190 RepID=UPI001BEB2FF5|nr:AvrD family protein [Streptomyces sp. ISL-94]MBT2481754.1 hypothetical protein [Streptomyces sp. ISL-94]
MQTTGLGQPLRIADVDDVLGDRHARFFGEGFKRVTYTLADVTITPSTATSSGQVHAFAGIHLPETWSRKGQTLQRPHLSTLDGMLLAAQLTGLYAAHTHRLGPDAQFRVRAMRLKAGTMPDEEGLERFGVTARRLSTTASPYTSGWSLTTADCTIGSMSVQIEAEHPTADQPDGAQGSYATAEELNGPWNSAVFGFSHRHRSQHLEDVVTDIAEGTAHARLTLVDTPGQGPAAAQEPTAIDLFVSALQLGQVLLYELDNLSRAESNTLWMRSTTFTSTTEAEPDGRFRVALGRSNELPSAEGTWRTAQITAALGGTKVTCNVAHLLP